MKTPTPGGVPVSIRSPGRRVKNLEHQDTNSSHLNTNCFVLEFCIVSPLTKHLRFKL